MGCLVVLDGCLIGFVSCGEEDASVSKIIESSIIGFLFFLVGIFGSRERRIKAAYYLMFYTLFGSVPFLIGLIYI